MRCIVLSRRGENEQCFTSSGAIQLLIRYIISKWMIDFINFIVANKIQTQILRHNIVQYFFILLKLLPVIRKLSFQHFTIQSFLDHREKNLYILYSTVTDSDIFNNWRAWETTLCPPLKRTHNQTYKIKLNTVYLLHDISIIYTELEEVYNNNFPSVIWYLFQALENRT